MTIHPISFLAFILTTLHAAAAAAPTPKQFELLPYPDVASICSQHMMFMIAKSHYVSGIRAQQLKEAKQALILQGLWLQKMGVTTTKEMAKYSNWHLVVRDRGPLDRTVELEYCVAEGQRMFDAAKPNERKSYRVAGEDNFRSLFPQSEK